MIQPINPTDPGPHGLPAVDPVQRRRRIADEPRREDAREERRAPAGGRPPRGEQDGPVDGDGHLDVLA